MTQEPILQVSHTSPASLLSSSSVVLPGTPASIHPLAIRSPVNPVASPPDPFKCGLVLIIVGRETDVHLLGRLVNNVHTIKQAGPSFPLNHWPGYLAFGVCWLSQVFCCLQLGVLRGLPLVWLIHQCSHDGQWISSLELILHIFK